MKKNRLKKMLVISMLCFGSFATIAQTQSEIALERTEVTNTVTYQTTIDGIEVSYSSLIISDGVSVLNVEFKNTLDSKTSFSWKINRANGFSQQGKEITLVAGEKLTLNNVVEMKGNMEFSSYIMNLIIKK